MENTSTTSKAMNLQEAKDNVAKETVYKNWQNIEDELRGTEDYIELLEKAAELYASSQSAALKEINKEMIEKLQEVWDACGTDKLFSVFDTLRPLISKAKELTNGDNKRQNPS